MDFNLWWQGILMGFSIAAPVGPIGVLCIRRTLVGGRLNGWVSGMGAATADAFYGWLAGSGLAFAAHFLTGQQSLLRGLGGAFLIYLGVKTWLAQPARLERSAQPRSLPGAYLSTLALTLSNPATILSFVGIFAGLGLLGQGKGSGAVLSLVAGVFCGSAAWWLLLASLVGLFRERFTARGLRWVNRISGVVIAGFGLLALISIVWGWGS